MTNAELAILALIAEQPRHGYDIEIVRLSKEHNNANVLSLGARFIKTEQAIEAVQLWLDTKFTSEKRHQRRIKKICEYENKEE